MLSDIFLLHLLLEIEKIFSMSSSVNSPRQNETTNYREQFPLKQSNTLTAAALVGEDW